MINDIIKNIENKQIKKDLPKFRSGDTVEVKLWVIEGNKKRIQLFEGVIISIKNNNLNSSITLRKISHGEGVERLFKIHSPNIDKFIIKKHGKVRKSKLYYLRNKFGKNSKIKERLK